MVAISQDLIPSTRKVLSISYFNEVQLFLTTRYCWSSADEQSRALIRNEVPYFAKTIAHFRQVSENVVLENIYKWF